MSPRGPVVADIAALAQDCLWKLRGHVDVCRLNNMMKRLKRAGTLRSFEIHYDNIGYLQRVAWWPHTEKKPLRVGYWV